MNVNKSHRPIQFTVLLSYADAETVAAMDRILTTNTGHFSVSFGLSNGPYEPERTSPIESFRVDAAFDGAYTERGLTATRHVPHIDPIVPYALQWYALTAIERSVTTTMQSSVSTASPLQSRQRG